MSGYTVIDVETTGFVPEKHDRIVEIGVVYVNAMGEIQDQWSTLVNPMRDVGPTHIHGITARDVLEAPTFAELAPYVLRAVRTRTLVAHNSSFDLRFLAAELIRAGVPLSELPLAGVCTMTWSGSFAPSTGRGLVDCCRACGVELKDHHSAMADARATAELLSYYLRAAGGVPPWADTIDRSRAYAWPTYHGDYPELQLLHRSDMRSRREDTWLDRIIAHMPRAANPRVDSYLAVLEMALVDGYLAEHEKDALVQSAAAEGLSKGQVLDLHGEYLNAMAGLALLDGVVSEAELADLRYVASVLGLSEADIDAGLNAAADAAVQAAGFDNDFTRVGIALHHGDRVAFTGTMSRERSDLEMLASYAGLVPGNLTRSTVLLVAADPDSMSGKAAKARSYGIPIVTEAAFGKLLNEIV